METELPLLVFLASGSQGVNPSGHQTAVSLEIGHCQRKLAKVKFVIFAHLKRTVCIIKSIVFLLLRVCLKFLSLCSCSLVNESDIIMNTNQ